MDDLPKHVKRGLRELASRAHEAELHAELAKLAEHFDAWRRGDIDSFALRDRIHEFLDGAEREIDGRYERGVYEFTLAHGIQTGRIDRSTVPAPVLDALARHLAFYEDMERAEGAAESIADDLR